MKISDGYLLRTVAGKNIVVSVGADVNFNGMLTLNDTGVFFWNLLKNNTTKVEMLEKILEEFDVSPQQASQDIDEFIEKLSEAKILED
ncbi:MAG: PqqD family protein [Clostridia bacterium]|nr:PqqD family protein [Clostridia bacterium]